MNNNPPNETKKRTIRNRIGWISLMLLSILCLQQPPARGQMHVGTNLDGIADWGATQFADVMKHQRDWMTRNADGSGDWDTDFNQRVPRDRNGWPTVIPFDPGNGEPPQIVHTIFPVRGPGNYRLIVQGKGSIEFIASEGLLDPTNPFNNSVSIELTGGRRTLNLKIHDSPFGNGVGTIALEYHRSDASDPIRDMRLVTPGHVGTHWSKPFLPSYTDNLAMFSNLRFMDWGNTNGNSIKHWRNRTRRATNTQAGSNGVALEFMIQLANQQNQDMWMCIPANADDRFVRLTAYVIKRRLRRNRKVFVEYSNETWNSIFPQTAFVQEQGLQLGLSNDPWEAGQMFVAKRSAEIWKIFEKEFGTTAADRLVKVMASHSENVSLSTARLDHLENPVINPDGIRADAISIAPYFGGSVAQELVTEGIVDSVTPAEIVDRALDDMRNSATESVAVHQMIAQEYDLWLVLYEGGQHLVGGFEDFGNQALTDKLNAANRHPSMYDVYYEYLNMLNDHEVVLFSNFSYVYRPSQFGSWGILEDQDQPIQEAPKFEAISDWILSNPAANVPPVSRPGDDLATVDADGDGFERVFLDGSPSRDFDGKITSYVWSIDGETILRSATGTVKLPQDSHEITLTVTDDAGASTARTINVTIAPVSATKVLVQSDFQGNAPATNTPWKSTSQLGDNVTFGGWEIGSGLSAAAVANGFGFSGDYTADPRTLAEAISNDEYVGFEVAPESGYELDLRGATLTFTIERLSYHAPRRLIVFSSVDGFAEANSVFSSRRIEQESPVELSLTLPFEGYRTDAPVEFRIYVADGQWSGHEVRLNSFKLNGAAARSTNSPLERLLRMIP